MIIVVEKVTQPWLIDAACEFTSGQTRFTMDNTDMYHAEHSPIRTQCYWIKMWGIPTYVSTHFVRHKVGVEHFVRSNRDTEANRMTPVDHAMFANAAALIAMARKRLCGKADRRTREAMEKIVESMKVVDKELAVNMVRECVYRNGHCPELKPCWDI
jgi:hypothetical protein